MSRAGLLVPRRRASPSLFALAGAAASRHNSLVATASTTHGRARGRRLRPSPRARRAGSGGIPAAAAPVTAEHRICTWRQGQSAAATAAHVEVEAADTAAAAAANVDAEAEAAAADNDNSDNVERRRVEAEAAAASPDVEAAVDGTKAAIVEPAAAAVPANVKADADHDCAVDVDRHQGRGGWRPHQTPLQ